MIAPLLKAAAGLADAVEASIHFVEHLDLLTADDPGNPWPDGFPGIEGLVTARDNWRTALGGTGTDA